MAGRSITSVIVRSFPFPLLPFPLLPLYALLFSSIPLTATYPPLNPPTVWSNFEIADMDFWRSEAYTKFFDYLDSKGGFYYERWGDAPVHSIAAALFLRKDQIHFFREIGYEHNPFNHCPQEEELWRRGRCSCNPEKTFGECFCFFGCLFSALPVSVSVGFAIGFGLGFWGPWRFTRYRKIPAWPSLPIHPHNNSFTPSSQLNFLYIHSLAHPSIHSSTLPLD